MGKTDDRRLDLQFVAATIAGKESTGKEIEFTTTTTTMMSISGSESFLFLSQETLVCKVPPDDDGYSSPQTFQCSNFLAVTRRATRVRLRRSVKPISFTRFNHRLTVTDLTLESLFVCMCESHAT